MEVVFLFVMVIGLMLIGVPIAVSLGMSSILFLLLLSMTLLLQQAESAPRSPLHPPCSDVLAEKQLPPAVR